MSTTEETIHISCHNFTSAQLSKFLTGSHRTIPERQDSLTASQPNTTGPIIANKPNVHYSPELTTIDPRILTTSPVDNHKSEPLPCVHGLTPAPTDRMEHIRNGLLKTGIHAHALETSHIQQLLSSNITNEARKALLQKWRAVTVTIPHFLLAQGTDTSAMTFQDFEEIYNRTCRSEEPRPESCSEAGSSSQQPEMTTSASKWSPYDFLNLANELERQQFAAEIVPPGEIQPGQHHQEVCDADVDYVDDFRVVSSAESARRQRESERVGAKR